MSFLSLPTQVFHLTGDRVVWFIGIQRYLRLSSRGQSTEHPEIDFVQDIQLATRFTNEQDASHWGEVAKQNHSLDRCLGSAVVCELEVTIKVTPNK